MNQYVLPAAVTELFEPHFRRRALLDTNVLLLLVLGKIDPNQVSRGCLSKYDYPDFVALHLICERFSALLTTPHILTEACHIGSKDVSGPKRDALYALLRSHSQNGIEQTISLSALGLASLVRVGVADSVTDQLCDSNTLLISDDRELCGIVARRGRHVVNFNHVRETILGL